MYRITTMYPEDPRAPFYNPGAKEIPPMARLYLTREKLIPRSCDEETLLSQVVEEAENSQAADRRECSLYSPGQGVRTHLTIFTSAKTKRPL